MNKMAVKKGTPSLTAPRRTATVQPKLMVNAPGDRYEQEADAMADQVMRMPQHQPTTPVRPAATGMIARSIQRKCAACEAGGKTCSSCAEEDKKKKLMRKAEGGGGGFAASPGLVSQLGATRGGGSPLPTGTRSFMENAFSTDFSGVRVHTDGRAAEMSRGIQAKAFTYGSDIYFNGGEFAPESDGGKRLLAHELGHVIQQGYGGASVERLQRDEFRADAVKEMIDALFDGDFRRSQSIAETRLSSSEKDFVLANEGMRKVTTNHLSDKSMYELMLSFLTGSYQNLYGCLDWMFSEADKGELEWQRVIDIIIKHSIEERKKILYDYNMKVRFQVHFDDSQIYELIRFHFAGINLYMSLEWMFHEADEGELAWYRVMDVISMHPSVDERKEVLEDMHKMKQFQTHFGDEEIYALMAGPFMGLGLHKNLEWMFHEADEGEMEILWLLDIVQKYPSGEWQSLYTDEWKMRFQKVFDDWEVEIAVKGLGFNLSQKLDWMLYEGTNKQSVFAAIDLASAEEAGQAVADAGLMERLYQGLKNAEATQALWEKAPPETREGVDFRILNTYDTQQDDTIEKIIRKHYPKYDYTTGNDRRTIAEAIKETNRGNECIYFKGHKQKTSVWGRMKRWAKDKVFDRDMAVTRENYDLMKVKAGCKIDLPKTEYIEFLRATEQISTRSEWKNTAVSLAQGIDGFINGVDDGFRNAIIDTVKSIATLIRDIFTGKIFTTIYEIAKKLINMSLSEIWEAIKDFAKGIWQNLEDRWNNPNPYKKWYFVGEIVGMVIFEALLAFFTAGVGTAIRHSARLQRFLSKFKFLDEALDLATAGKSKMDLPDADLALRQKKLVDLDLPDAQTAKLMKGAHIDDAADLLKHPDILDAEMQTRDLMIHRGDHFLLGGPFDIEVDLPNGHKWEHHIDSDAWCRLSKRRCLIDTDGDGLLDSGVEEHDLPKVRGDDDSIKSRYGDYDDEPGSILDSYRIDPKRKGHSAEEISDKMMTSSGYKSLGKITRSTDPDRGPGIDGLWKSPPNSFFVYTVTETKHVTGFGRYDLSVYGLLKRTKRDGTQLSDRWIKGSNRIEKLMEHSKDARKVRMALSQGKIERLLIVIDETGASWIFEVDSDGVPFKLKR